MKIEIRKVTEDNTSSVTSLWEDYQRFYKVENIDTEKNRTHIKTIAGSPDKGMIFVAVDGKNNVGFYTLYFTFASTIASQVALLNDLYVDAKYREKQIGKQLLDHALNTVKQLGITQVRWVTQEDNERAMRLYKHYATPTKWFSFSVKV